MDDETIKERLIRLHAILETQLESIKDTKVSKLKKKDFDRIVAYLSNAKGTILNIIADIHTADKKAEKMLEEIKTLH